MLCGIETCFTSVGIGTDFAAGAEASAGGVRIVAAASRAKRLEKRINLNSPEKNNSSKWNLMALAMSATALAQCVWIFDERQMTFSRVHSPDPFTSPGAEACHSCVPEV